MTAADPQFWPADQWRALQWSRLTAHVRRAAASPLYRDAGLHQAAAAAEGGGGTEALLPHLPLTTKEQLVNGAAVAVAPADVAEWVCTSGTAGAPLDVPLTAADLRRLAANEAAALGIAGVGPGDVVLLAVGMDRLFVAGLAYWLGASGA